jgi:DNA adenine methylase
LIRKHLSGTYYEPFLGGGSIFFALAPPRAVLADINRDLINTYQMVKQHPVALVRRLRALPVTSSFYYQLREEDATAAISRAVRFLYLNRTCFGGIYRENANGLFNVPYGGGCRTPEILWNRKLISNAAAALKCVELVSGDFELTMNRAGPGDVVYCDPTYSVAHDNNGFVRYNESNFSWRDQERLAESATRAANRGATVFVSNAHHRSVRSLFRPQRCWTLKRISRVSAAPGGRRPVKEYLFFWQGTSSG